MSGPCEGRRIVLGVTGGIAAYKAVEVCRRLVDAGAHVIPVLTDDATRFVGEVTFSALASEPVRRSLWDGADPIPHTKLGQSADLIELRVGDALVTLKDCGGPVDFLLVDGFPEVARPIIELMAPQLRKGAMVVCDNVGHFPAALAFYLDFVRRPASGFVSTLLPLRGGTELSVKT